MATLSCLRCAVCSRNAGFFQTEASCDSSSPWTESCGTSATPQTQNRAPPHLDTARVNVLIDDIQTVSICTILPTHTLNSSTPPSVRTESDLGERVPGLLASGKQSRAINVAATSNKCLEPWGEQSLAADLILEPAGIGKGHLLVSLSGGQPSDRGGELTVGAGGESGQWMGTAVQRECQRASSSGSWRSSRSCSTSWIAAIWNSEQWMKSGPTSTSEMCESLGNTAVFCTKEGAGCFTVITPLLRLVHVVFAPRAVAQNRKTLHNMGITHVLNAAHSKQGSIGDQSFYGDTCVYLGIPAEDSDSFDLDQYFKMATDFIHKALKNRDGTMHQSETR